MQQQHGLRSTCCLSSLVLQILHLAFQDPRNRVPSLFPSLLTLLSFPLQETPPFSTLPSLSALPLFEANLHPVPSCEHLLSSGVNWARSPLLQTSSPEKQALVYALYGAPYTSQCLLDECTRSLQKAARLSGEERFLFYSPQFGLSNQLLAYADMTVLAATLHRTLVLPPLRQKDGTFLPVHSLLDLEQVFYFPHKRGSSNEGVGKVRAMSHDDFMRLVMRGQPLTRLVRFDWSDRFGGREKDDKWLTQNGLLDKR